MFGDLLTFVFFAVFVYLLVKVFVKGIIPGVFDVVKFLVKFVLGVTLGPVFFLVKLLTNNFETERRPIGVGRETVTVTDRYRDKNGRIFTINKTYDLGSRLVTKRDVRKGK